MTFNRKRIDLMNDNLKVKTLKETKKIKVGKLLADIERIGNKISLSLPKDTEIKKLKPQDRRIIEHISELLKTTKEAKSWDNAQLTSFARELGWISTIAYIQNNLGLGNSDGGGKTCAGRCQDKYNNCMKERGCTKDGWICLCCTPCSLLYMGCITRCALSKGPGIGIA